MCASAVNLAKRVVEASSSPPLAPGQGGQLTLPLAESDSQLEVPRDPPLAVGERILLPYLIWL